ncbi:MAG TPA: metallophosphoesterase [Candidatus Acidoferrales bacterium]|nr:metallophosphoesterase [Candidatus Acidoferrales bacterium]
MRSRISVFVSIVQVILLLTHLFLYETWIYFHGPSDPSQAFALKMALSILSVSFVPASLLAQKYSNSLVRAIYTISAIWLGLVNFFFLAAGAIWLIYGIPLLFGIHLDKRDLACASFVAGLLAGILALLNAAWPRVVRVTIKLPNLPASWRGRTAALVSDLHLGHVRNTGFLRRIVQKLARLQPDVLFIPGDMFDGTAVDFGKLSKIWNGFSAPLGSYFIAGNHEQFSSYEKYFGPVAASGIRIVQNEKILLDGLQLVGVHYVDSKNMERFRSILAKSELDPDVASILLVHDPNLLPIAVEAGISLQLSGHTHRGQFFPFTKIVSRIYGIYAYGLHRFDTLQVYTSCGVGTWGPPMRLGSNPEIVMIRFE